MDQRPSNALGDFLRAQRSRITPQEAGLLTGGDRRVAGLRREEVAVLAGVSADYYTRLEQGRERTPSAQVVDALCKALRLGRDARDHIFRLARLSPTAPGSVDEVSSELLHMIDGLPHAAYVTNPAFRVLAANAAADVLIAPVRPPDGILSAIFLGDAARQFYANWEHVARTAVDALRHSAGFVPPHPEVTEVVERLYRDSRDFRRIWDDQNVSGLALTQTPVRHPAVGLMDLNFQAFDIRSAPGQQLTVVTAEPGSPSADALTRLVASGA